MHIFGYSSREGTKAANLPDQIPGLIIKDRAQQLLRLANSQKQATLQRNIGREFMVLWEAGSEPKVDGTREFPGYTPNYLKVVAMVGMGEDLCRHIAPARLIGMAENGGSLIAELMPMK